MSNTQHVQYTSTRRQALTSAAWSAPILLLAVSAPSAAASVGPSASGGVLNINGGAYANYGITFGGSNYNGFTATGNYQPGEVTVVITLPSGVAASTSGTPVGFSYQLHSNVVTLTNTVPLPKDRDNPVLNGFTILGSFSAGSSYSIQVHPAPIGVTLNGLAALGTF